MKRKLKSTRGMTLVSVLTAFVMLLIVLSMFYGAVRFSNTLVNRSTDLRKDAEQSIEDYYLHAQEESTVLEEQIRLQPQGSAAIIELPVELREMDNGIKYFADKDRE